MSGVNSEINIRILCVEDEREIRENIVEILRMEGFEVFEASDGKEGLVMFHETNPDIIISDIMMPEVDGYQFLQNVRNSNARNSNVPFIFLSALGQKKDIIKGASLFANDYLLKPVDFEIMIAKVKEKAINSLRIQELQQQDISNIKDQVAVILPSDLSSRIAEAVMIIEKLKEEPYGPLPHRLYLEDFNLLDQKLKGLKAVVINSLDASVVEKRLNANEKVISSINLLKEIKSYVEQHLAFAVEIPEDNNFKNFPQIRIEVKSIAEVFSVMIKAVASHFDHVSFSLSAVVDYQNQLAIICYIKNDNQDLPLNLPLEQILITPELTDLIEKEALQFAIGRTNQANQHQSFVIAIPSYRIVN
jgi:CheY-like chemotaxis protein